MKSANNMQCQHVSLGAITHWVLVTLLLLIMHPVYSATINVTSTADVLADDGVCTLREAVIAANENFPSGLSGGECITGSIGLDTIILVNPGVYGFSIPGADEDLARTGDLDLTEAVNIEGRDAATFIVNAAFLDRVLSIETDVDVTLRGITLTGGLETSRGSLVTNTGGGGGIYSDGNLTIEDSVIAGNSVTGTFQVGGGITSSGDTLILSRTTVKNNHATNIGSGGGLYSYFTATITVNDCIFEGNSAFNGGGIEARVASTISLTDSTFSGNHTDNAGGGIASGNSDLIVVRSTFVGNTADRGGAIFTGAGNHLVSNSTFSSNSATTTGGGINEGANLILQQTTFDQGYDITSSAIYVGWVATVTVSNTLISGRCGGDLLVSHGGNIETPGNTCGLVDLTDQSGVSATAVNLGPLSDNGGKTLTQLPGSNSIALEMGVGDDCLPDDQRGILRPQDFDGLNGAECDVGAVELFPCQHDAVLTLDDTTVWVTPTFEACERIEAGNGFEVTDPDTIMHAGNAVVFTPDFSVLAGASLSVEVDWAFWEDMP